MRMQAMRARAAALLLCGVGLGALACGAGETSDEVGAPALLAAIEARRAPLLLDVRSPEEFAGGHVPGARNIPIDELAARTQQLAAHREQPIVVYCETGRRAEAAYVALEAAGFSAVRRLTGHMAGWRAAELPVE